MPFVLLYCGCAQVQYITYIILWRIQVRNRVFYDDFGRDETDLHAQPWFCVIKRDDARETRAATAADGRVVCSKTSRAAPKPRMWCRLRPSPAGSTLLWRVIAHPRNNICPLFFRRSPKNGSPLNRWWFTGRTLYVIIVITSMHT